MLPLSFCLMDALIERIRRIAKLNPDVVIARILNDDKFKRYITDLNTEGEETSQLFEKGVNSLGVRLENVGGGHPVTGLYAPSTIEGISGLFEGKISKGQPIDRITLKDTGEFYDSFRVKVFVEGDVLFEIDADPQKSDGNLYDDWGIDIVGLTDDNIQLLINKLRDEITQYIREHVLV